MSKIYKIYSYYDNVRFYYSIRVDKKYLSLMFGDNNEFVRSEVFSRINKKYRKYKNKDKIYFNNKSK